MKIITIFFFFLLIGFGSQAQAPLPYNTFDPLFGFYAKNFNLKGAVKSVETLEDDTLVLIKNFDIDGKLLEQIAYLSPSSNLNYSYEKKRYTYNEQGQPTEVKEYIVTENNNEKLSYQLSYQYNKRGLPQKCTSIYYHTDDTTKNQTKNTLIYSYNRYNLLAKEQFNQNDGYSIFSYNADSLLVEWKRYNNAGGIMKLNTKNTYTYNNNKQLIKEENEAIDSYSGWTLVYQYDTLGRLINQKGEHYVRSYTYNNSDWPLEGRNPNYHEHHALYFDEKGNCIRAEIQSDGEKAQSYTGPKVIIYKITYY